MNVSPFTGIQSANNPHSRGGDTDERRYHVHRLGGIMPANLVWSHYNQTHGAFPFEATPCVFG